MLKSRYSPLVGLRVEVSSDRAKSEVEISDPQIADKHIKYFSKDTTVCDLNKFVDNLKYSVVSDDAMDKLYQHWIQYGWRRSLDYYLFSRSWLNTSSSEKQIEPKIACDSLCNYKHSADEVRHSLLGSLINRRTKRLFTGNGVKTEIFNLCVEKLAEYFLPGIELYFIAYNVQGLTPGAYIYNTDIKKPFLIEKGQFSEEMSKNIQGLAAPKTATFSIILSVNFDIFSKSIPHPRGLRNLYIEVGRLSQKIIILFGQYEIYSLVTPALSDRSVSKLLKLDDTTCAPLYSLTFGYAKK